MSEGERRYVPSAAERGPAICERCGKPGERTGDRINPDGWFWLAAKFDPESKPKHAADDRLIIHACSVECRDALWSGKPRTFAKTTFRERKQPKVYPCGCARQHVNRGLCADYEPGELP